ncbi:CDC14-domain-containing protein [Athelia psychrophila]|uniref:CDC14-domain-containing protein n=1 Tax=Athelia psychrophila TaxID=1759441 RepID=A0A167X1W3_9AGAM|nr:CDC14-domain-containing protein [Fibularhizoctonia sp. CBS 109695]
MDLASLKSSTQDALDDLVSSRSSTGRRTRALAALEHLLALAFVPRDTLDELDQLMQLQDSFECNVSVRMLPWIAISTNKLESLAKALVDHDQEAEVSMLESHLSQSLSLLQGFALNHKTSKQYMGRKYALQVLLDLLITCNHLPPKSEGQNTGPSAPLSSVVLDTLLCILVDSSTSLRAFERCDGVQTVVKVLKTAGSPKEVRMKCLEFLYFYLMDETTPASSQNAAYRQELFPSNQPPSSPSKRAAAPGSPTKTVPGTPSHTRQTTAPSSPTKPRSKSKPFPSSRIPSASSSNAWGSISSFASEQSISTRSTTPEPTEPDKTPPPVPKTPSKSHASRADQPRSAVSGRIPICPPVILRSDVDIDYVPISPKKPKMARVGAGNMPGGMPSKVRDLRDLSTGAKAPGTPSKAVLDSPSKHHRTRETSPEAAGDIIPAIRSADEKKEILGGMLGNVDALVAGVRKAGVWGLG